MGESGLAGLTRPFTSMATSYSVNTIPTSPADRRQDWRRLIVEDNHRILSLLLLPSGPEVPRRRDVNSLTSLPPSSARTGGAGTYQVTNLHQFTPPSVTACDAVQVVIHRSGLVAVKRQAGLRQDAAGDATN